MAYENINVNQLRSSIRQCLNSIDYSESKEVLSSIKNNGVWNTASRNTLSTALDKLVDTRYKDLEKTLKAYLKIVDKIEEYQKLSKQIDGLNSELSTMNSNLTTAKNVGTQLKSSNADASKQQENDNKINNLNSKISSKKKIPLLVGDKKHNMGFTNMTNKLENSAISKNSISIAKNQKKQEEKSGNRGDECGKTETASPRRNSGFPGA